MTIGATASHRKGQNQFIVRGNPLALFVKQIDKMNRLSQTAVLHVTE
jgi:hypothetical protein